MMLGDETNQLQRKQVEICSVAFFSLLNNEIVYSLCVDGID